MGTWPALSMFCCFESFLFFLSMFFSTPASQAVAVVQRNMRKQDPSAVMRSLGFGPLLLISSFPVKMCGSGRTFTAYVFSKITPASAAFLASTQLAGGRPTACSESDESTAIACPELETCTTAAQEQALRSNRRVMQGAKQTGSGVSQGVPGSSLLPEALVKRSSGRSSGRNAAIESSGKHQQFNGTDVTLTKPPGKHSSGRRQAVIDGKGQKSSGGGDMALQTTTSGKGAELRRSSRQSLRRLGKDEEATTAAAVAGTASVAAAASAAPLHSLPRVSGRSTSQNSPAEALESAEGSAAVNQRRASPAAAKQSRIVDSISRKRKPVHQLSKQQHDNFSSTKRVANKSRGGRGLQTSEAL